MRRNFIVAIVAVASMATATVLTPAAAGAAAPPAASDPPPVATCANPPATPDATPANRDRFVQLWSARFADHTWLTNYTKLATVPDNIQAEGFNSMDAQTQAWLDSCLLDNLLATTGENPSPEKRASYLTGIQMIIFGKSQLNQIRQGLTNETPSTTPQPQAVNQGETAKALNSMSNALLANPSLQSANLPQANVTTPTTTTSSNLAAQTTGAVQNMISTPAPTPKASQPQGPATPAVVPATPVPNPITKIPLVPQILQGVQDLLQLVSKIEGVLFTLPVVNILASAFYKICAESPTMSLRCSISVPIGVPVPADVNGDNVPDVLAALVPVTNLSDIGVKFQVTRINGSGALPAHVFAVYDTPIVKKRIEVGFDGRASSLAFNQGATFTVKNIFKALTGDIQVGAVVTASQTGPAESLTFAVKDLTGGSVGVPPTEDNPISGSVQMNPFPAKFTVDARFTHTNAQDEDTFNVTSTVATTVSAIVDQKTTTTSPQSDRVFTALIDQLPTAVTVDLVHTGAKQSIDYQANAPIAHVQATDTATGDVSQPGSYTQSQYDVFGVPTAVHVDLTGAQDIKYTANGNIPTAAFSTQTLVTGSLQQQINVTAHQIPKSIHVTNVTTPDQQAVTYDADTNLGDIQLGMYDKSASGDETNLSAQATSIPTHMAFTQTKSTGVYDLSANQGIGLITATLTRNGGSVLPLPGKDHATVLKQGNKLGLDFQLTGFKSAHFDGSAKTVVSLGLDPGGQSFDAIADLDSPNILATAHIDALPSSMAVTFDPAAGAANYTASSIIPEMDATFTNRDSGMTGSATLKGLPKTIGLTFNTSGDSPSVTYNADSRLQSIDLNYSQKPGGLAIHAAISNLPQYMTAGGLNPIVFDARTGPFAPSASSDIGQILFQYATDGTFASPPTTDDHAYLNTDTVSSTHAELLYSGLSYISVDTTSGALHASIKNSAPRLFRAYLTTPTLSLTGFIDKVPASIDVAQVGNLVTYDASSPISEISTNLVRSNGDQLAVDLLGIPSHIDVTFDGAASSLVWNSSAPVTSISALAHLTPATIGGTRAFDAGLTITGIPVHWDANWANGNVLFEAPSPGIGSIAAQVTNHGAYHVLSGDHLSAYYDQASGDLDASLHISNLTKAGFTKITDASGGGFEAALNMGNQGDFKFAADVHLTSTTLTANGEFNHLPSAIDLKSDGGRITYTGNSNPDLTLSVAAGTPAAIAATPTPNNVHGISVRDGSDGTNVGVKANLYLTGLPDSLDLNPTAGTYQVNGYHPSIGTLVVDVALTALVSKPLTLLLTQGVPTATPVNFTFGPFTSSTAGDGTHNLSLNYTANQPLGALDAEATYGDTTNGDDAKLSISQIPASISVNAGFGANQKTVGITMSQGISDITASYKKLGASQLAASVHLHDVPSAVNLVIGRATASDGSKDVTAPDFTLTASQPGLDIDAAATDAITDPISADAALQLQITNMGSTVTGALNGTTLKITSSPATQSFLLNASGGVHLNVDLGFSAGPLTNTGSLGVDVAIHQITLGFENASSLQLDLGITTGLKGDYSNFTFGLDTDTTINLQDTLKLVIGTPFGDVNINIFNLDPTTIPLHNVIDHFRLASNREANIFSLDIIDVGLGYCSFDISVRPHFEYSTNGSSFSVGQPPSDGVNDPAWLVAPDPNLLGFSLPDFVMDVLMYFTSPYGHNIDGSLGCHSRL